jgi:hypothetical protein
MFIYLSYISCTILHSSYFTCTCFVFYETTTNTCCYRGSQLGSTRQQPVLLSLMNILCMSQRVPHKRRQLPCNAIESSVKILHLHLTCPSSLADSADSAYKIPVMPAAMGKDMNLLTSSPFWFSVLSYLRHLEGGVLAHIHKVYDLVLLLLL